jgi:phosphoglycerol transferase
MYRLFSLSLLLSLPAISALTMTDAPIQWALLNFLFTAAALYSLLGISTFKLKRGVILLLVLAVFSLNVSFFSSWYLQNLGFNDAFFYHMRLDLFAAGIKEFMWPLIAVSILLIVVVALSCSLSHRQRDTWTRLQCVMSLSFISVLLVFNSPVLSLASYLIAPLMDNKPTTDAALALLKEARAEPAFDLDAFEFSEAKDKPNIVLIYLESVEQAYFDEDIFPELLPRLTEIKNKSINFNGLQQLDGTGWTIAGTVASQCGLPLRSPHSISHNNMTVSDDFMGQAICYGDLLKSIGYDNHFMGGANLDFAGKGKFYKSHNYDFVKGYKALNQYIPKGEKIHNWGLYDKQLLKLATQEFDVLSNQNKPFSLAVLTIDTHHPTGAASPGCKPYQKEDNLMLDAVYCTDQVVSQFIEHIRASDISDNTYIAVVSDHLAMRNSVSDRLKASNSLRKLTFFINTPDGATLSSSDAGTHFDVSATILQAAGLPLKNNLGFGRSMLTSKGDSQPGLVHEVAGGYVDVTKEKVVTDFVNSKWFRASGTLSKGIKIKDEGRVVEISEQRFTLNSEGWVGGDPATFAVEVDPETLEIISTKLWAWDWGLSAGSMTNLIMDNPDSFYFILTKAVYLPSFYDQSDENKYVYFLGGANATASITAEYGVEKNIKATDIQRIANSM